MTDFALHSARALSRARTGEAVISRAGVTLVTIADASFSDEYAESSLASVGISGSAPRLQILASLLAGVRKGDQLTHLGNTYVIRSFEPQPIGGTTLLVLEKQ